MIKDRGKIKWGATFMLPEMLASQNKVDWDYKKVDKPILDEHLLEEINQTICSAMEYNQELVFTLYGNGEFQLLTGKVHYIDQIMYELRILDKFNEIHRVRLATLLK
ncbi:YolD-like family protein [Bacillus sp. JJ1533]|uniref:YolD-like family protein n=1 Tax=Bacillus sp. JJ1533 TaxID=3122959 RepID=UPI002FFDC7AD